jgi:hypothetical protein
MPVVVISDALEAKPLHEGLNFLSSGSTSRPYRRLRHHRPKAIPAFNKSLETQGRTGKEQIVQSETVEEIRVTQMETEIVPLENPVGRQIDIVLLSSNATLLPPLPFEGSGIQ